MKEKQPKTKEKTKQETEQRKKKKWKTIIEETTKKNKNIQSHDAFLNLHLPHEAKKK